MAMSNSSAWKTSGTVSGTRIGFRLSRARADWVADSRSHARPAPPPPDGAFGELTPFGNSTEFLSRRDGRAGRHCNDLQPSLQDLSACGSEPNPESVRGWAIVACPSGTRPCWRPVELPKGIRARATKSGAAWGDESTIFVSAHAGLGSGHPRSVKIGVAAKSKSKFYQKIIDRPGSPRSESR